MNPLAAGMVPVGILLVATALPAQPQAPRLEAHRFAVTSMPEDVADVTRVDSLIAELTRVGELTLVSSQPDRQLSGRLLEHFRQVHRGVPVLGAGLTRQRAGGMTVSVFGTIFSNVDIDAYPSVGADAALARIEAVAGIGLATSDPPRLVILRTPLGRLVLAWSAPVRDYRTYFVDAHSGELVYRLDHMRAEAAVGFGLGITGASQKLSVWKTGQSYRAWDRLRPAEVVTLDAEGDLEHAFALLDPRPAWEEAVADDDDNEWSSSAVVDGHAHIGFTYDYLFRVQGWRGMDGQDGRIFSVVNLDDFFNAFFVSEPFGPQGTGAVVFGGVPDGRPLVALDTVGHELMHGVTHSAFVKRTGLPPLDAQTWVPGPSSLRVEDDVIRCGDLYSFDEADDGLSSPPAPLLCFDDEGNPTQSRDGHLGLFLDEGGAINEGYSDIIGTAAEFAFHPPGDGLLRADYLQGEDEDFIVRRSDSPSADRIGPFTYPEALGQEFRFVVVVLNEDFIIYTRYGMRGNRPFRLEADGYSGVHWNSTILSHAAYLAIEGGVHAPTGTTVQGVGVANREQIERAFFRAFVDLAPPYTGFRDLGVLIRQAAVDIHGSGSSAHAAVDQALTAVGL